jgi:putative flippase GtrA
LDKGGAVTLGMEILGAVMAIIIAGGIGVIFLMILDRYIKPSDSRSTKISKALKAALVANLGLVLFIVIAYIVLWQLASCGNILPR